MFLEMRKGAMLEVELYVLSPARSSSKASMDKVGTVEQKYEISRGLGDPCLNLFSVVTRYLL
jgi:hypothetical protein